MGRTLFVTGIRRPEEMRERGGMRADLLLRVGASELIDELLCNFKQFVSCAIALNHLSVPHHVLPQGIYHTVPEKLRRHLLRALNALRQFGDCYLGSVGCGAQCLAQRLAQCPYASQDVTTEWGPSKQI
eukprot:1451738-Rhodomonas_salina.2